MRTRKWNEAQLRQFAQQVTSFRQLLRRLGLQAAGGNYSQISKYLKLYNIDITHFRGKAWNKGLVGIGKPRRKLAELLVRNSPFQSHKLKLKLFAVGLKHPCCELCGWSKTATDGRIPLELDHINGIKNDHRLENLRILCPNCHSLQPTHRGKNIKARWRNWYTRST